MDYNKIDRESIQAIAQELNRIQQQQNTAVNNKCASAHADNTRKNMQQKTSKKTHAAGDNKHANLLNNVATVGLFLFWAVVFIVLLIKLAPYI